MNKETIPEEDFSEVQKLIRKEEEAALTFFQQRDFNARVKERIETESKKKFTFPGWFRVPSPIPVLMAALLVVLVSIPLFIHLFSPPAFEKERKQLEGIFARLRFQEPPGPVEDKEETSVAHSPEYIALEWKFRQVLYSVYIRNGNVSEGNLPHIFNKVLFSVPMPGEEVTVFRESESLDSRTLEKRIQDMIKEKQLYRTLRNVRKMQEV